MHDEVVEGRVLAGKYRVERVLGKGGMGVVVAARHLQLDERVALKFMQPEALLNAEAVARFAREARAAVKIKSEHVARVSDVGTLENGAPYMVMEYLEGEDLSSWLQRQGRLPVEQAVEFVLQASEAIAEAHALGIVHRDLKPANLFVIRRPDGAWSVKVLDFGISKMTGVGSTGPDFGMTKTSAIMGSPHYMSPEQMRSVKTVDARSDIWAIGVILYELLSGVTPFGAEAFPELVLKIANDAPAPLRNRAPEVPPSLEAAILRCLEKDPGQRFTSMGELAAALVEFAPRRGRLSLERISGVLEAAGMPPSARTLPAVSGPGRPVDARTASSWGRTASGSSAGRRALLTGGGLLAIAALALIGYVRRTGARATGSEESRPAPPVPAAAATPAATPSAMPVPETAPAPTSAASAGSAAATPPAPKTPKVAAVAAKKAAVARPSAVPLAARAPEVKAAEPSAAPAPTPKPKPTVKNPNSVFDDR